MQKSSIEFLKKLVETPSPAGFEEPVQKLVREEIEKISDDIYTDVHGNVIAVKNPKGQPKIMLAGHCDEIGLMVMHITNEGYIHFSAIGGVDTSLVPGQRVVIHSYRGNVHGIIGKKPIHLMDDEDRKKEVKIHNLWIDIGAKNKKEAEKYVSIGDPITSNVNFQQLLNNIVVAKGFDDKVGVFVVCEVLKSLKDKKIDCALFVVSTVQEELGLRGARTSAYGIDPDAGIAIDVTFATDHPEVDKKRIGEVSLGKGPVLHRGGNINPVLGKFLINTAKKKKIPSQLTGLPCSSGTDANAMQISRKGVATAVVSIPNRYMHTPVECVSLEDLDNAVKLLSAFILDVRKDVSFIPG